MPLPPAQVFAAVQVAVCREAEECVEGVEDTEANGRGRQLVAAMTRQLVEMFDPLHVKDRRMHNAVENYFHLIYCIAQTGSRQRAVLWSAGMVRKFIKFYHEYETANSQSRYWYPTAETVIFTTTPPRTALDITTQSM